jgi:hypothetical protein
MSSGAQAKGEHVSGRLSTSCGPKGIRTKLVVASQLAQSLRASKKDIVRAGFREEEEQENKAKGR